MKLLEDLVPQSRTVCGLSRRSSRRGPVISRIDWRSLLDARPVVVVFDNTDLGRPFRLKAIHVHGQRLG